jgi:hypothetical protein
MDEVGGFLAGERNYHKLQGSTGATWLACVCLSVRTGLT